MKRKPVKIDYFTLDDTDAIKVASLELSLNPYFCYETEGYTLIPDKYPIRLWSTASIVALNRHIIGA